jgi:hypothetical protein
MSRGQSKNAEEQKKGKNGNFVCYKKGNKKGRRKKGKK